METKGPHIRTIPVHCAPRKAPCPTCGKLGRRKATHNRLVRTIAYKQVVFLDAIEGDVIPLASGAQIAGLVIGAFAPSSSPASMSGTSGSRLCSPAAMTPRRPPTF